MAVGHGTRQPANRPVGRSASQGGSRWFSEPLARTTRDRHNDCDDERVVCAPAPVQTSAMAATPAAASDVAAAAALDVFGSESPKTR